MKNQILQYCRRCARSLLSGWKGWPLKDRVILLPRMIDGRCESCSGEEGVSGDRIAWKNIHGPYNTGLPDYWLLVLDDGVLDNAWGSPYFDESQCVRCGGRTIISEMLFPSGEREVQAACVVCNNRQTERDRGSRET